MSKHQAGDSISSKDGTPLIYSHPTEYPYKLNAGNHWRQVCLTGVCKKTVRAGESKVYYEARRSWFWGLWTSRYWIPDYKVTFFLKPTTHFFPINQLCKAPVFAPDELCED